MFNSVASKVFGFLSFVITVTYLMHQSEVQRNLEQDYSKLLEVFKVRERQNFATLDARVKLLESGYDPEYLDTLRTPLNIQL